MENPYRSPSDQASHQSHSSRTLSEPGLFGVVVRSLGLMSTMYAIQTGLCGFAPAAGYSPREYFVQGGVGVGAGMVLMFGADAIVRLLYGNTHIEQPEEGSAPAE